MSPSSARIGTRPGVSYTRLHRRWPSQLELEGTGRFAQALSCAERVAADVPVELSGVQARAGHLLEIPGVESRQRPRSQQPTLEGRYSGDASLLEELPPLATSSSGCESDPQFRPHRP